MLLPLRKNGLTSLFKEVRPFFLELDMGWPTFDTNISQGRKRNPKPKHFSLDIFRWGGGLPREGVGAKKFGMSFQTQ